MIKRLIVVFILLFIVIFGSTHSSLIDRALAATPVHDMNEAARVGDYTYKVIEVERKKDDPKSDFYFIKLSVANNSEFSSGNIPEIKLIDEGGKEFSPKEPRTKLDKNSSALLLLSFSIPKKGDYKLRVTGDEAGIDQAAIELTPKITDAPNDLLEASAAGDLKRIKKALKNGANVNYKNSKGETALMLAAGAGAFDAVKLLLDSGGNSWAKNNYDEPPLYYAIWAKNYDCVVILLKKGSETKYKSYYGKTAFDEASSMGNKAIIDIVRQYTDRKTPVEDLKSDSK